MTTPQIVLDCVAAMLYRAFRIRRTSGLTFEIQHPEPVRVVESTTVDRYKKGDSTEIPDQWGSVSLTFMESISHLEFPVAS